MSSYALFLYKVIAKLDKPKKVFNRVNVSNKSRIKKLKETKRKKNDLNVLPSHDSSQCQSSMFV